MDSRGWHGRFWNAWQLSEESHYDRAAEHLWKIAEAQFLDRWHGEWFKVLQPDGTPHPDYPKIGLWECPHHRSLACFEMLERLTRSSAARLPPG